jgi:hypothetical protein
MRCLCVSIVDREEGRRRSSTAGPGGMPLLGANTFWNLTGSLCKLISLVQCAGAACEQSHGSRRGEAYFVCVEQACVEALAGFTSSNSVTFSPGTVHLSCLRNIFGDSILVGDTRWAGSWGIKVWRAPLQWCCWTCHNGADLTACCSGGLCGAYAVLPGVHQHVRSAGAQLQPPKGPHALSEASSLRRFSTVPNNLSSACPVLPQADKLCGSTCPRTVNYRELPFWREAMTCPEQEILSRFEFAPIRRRIDVAAASAVLFAKEEEIIGMTKRKISPKASAPQITHPCLLPTKCWHTH